MTQNKHEVYLRNSVMQASKEDLTLMLYNGAIKFGNLAIVAIENGNVNEAHTNICKVQNIVHEFQVTLDGELEVSQSFAVMYEYMQRRLLEANLKKDKEIIEEVNGYLREFRDTWKEAMSLAKGKKMPIEQLA